MLKIVVPGQQELWDEKNEVFIYTNAKDVVLRLEHSLISISKWESKYHVSFLETDKTDAQILDYIKCMALNEVDDDVYKRLTLDNIRQINAYIGDPMTASTVRDSSIPHRSSERVTSELIYYWMITYGIPVEFEKWHINRLIMLIRICSAKAAGGKKMSPSEIMRENRALNAARRARLHTKG